MDVSKVGKLGEQMNRMESERYEYVTKSGVPVLFQRMNKDSMRYVVALNQIVNWGKIS